MATKYLVEVVSSTAYGNAKVGNIPLSEWLPVGTASQTLFAGLFRPIAPVRQSIEEAARKLYPGAGKVRAWEVSEPSKRDVAAAAPRRQRRWSQQPPSSNEPPVSFTPSIVPGSIFGFGQRLGGR